MSCEVCSPLKLSWKRWKVAGVKRHFMLEGCVAEVEKFEVRVSCEQGMRTRGSSGESSNARNIFRIF